MKRIIGLAAAVALVGAAPAAATVFEATVKDRSGLFSSDAGPGYVHVAIGGDQLLELLACQRGESLGAAYAYVSGTGQGPSEPDAGSGHAGVVDGSDGDPCPPSP